MDTTLPTNSDDLGGALDAVDDQLHDLLMRRVDLVLKLGEAAPALGGIAPAREANLLRRLIARHRGDLPADSLVRLWREMIMASACLQGRTSVAMHAPDAERAHWDMARAHFGGIEIVTFDSPAQVLRAVSDGGGQILGLLPAPVAGEPSIWWPSLLTAGPERPRAIARLPFIRYGQARPPIEALVIAPFDGGISGNDTTLCVITTAHDVSRGRLIDWLTAAGFDALPVDSRRMGGNDGDILNLVKLDGAVAEDDPRLQAVVRFAEGAVLGTATIGVYACPLDL